MLACRLFRPDRPLDRHRATDASMVSSGVMMDAISEVLRGVRLTGAFFFDNLAHDPWAITTPLLTEIAHVMPSHEHIISFHVVLEGACWVELTDNSAPPLRVAAGDVVVLPQGDEHVMASTQGMRIQPNYADFRVSASRGLPIRYVVNPKAGPPDCHFICGFFGCDSTPFNPLLSALPRIFVARGFEAGRPWVSALAQAGVEESGSVDGGGDNMLARVAELMFVDVVRRYADDLPRQSPGWLSGLKDRHIGAALRLIHERPTRPWTLAGMAREIGLSRSVFAERFSAHVGVSFAQYVVRWRLQLAVRSMEELGTTVAQAGADIGYGSEAAFRRAFKKYVGVSPGTWQKARRNRAVPNPGAGESGHPHDA